MTKKKPIDSPEPYKKDNIKAAEYIIGNEMRKCSDEIFEILMKYSFTPAVIYGILDSVKFGIMVDVYPFKFEVDSNEISQESIEKKVKRVIKEKEKSNQESEVMFS